MNDANERWLEGIRLLEDDIQRDAVLALLFFQHQQIVVQRAVGIDGHQADIPFVDGVVHQLDGVDVAFERVGTVYVAELLHETVRGLNASRNGALDEREIDLKIVTNEVSEAYP